MLIELFCDRVVLQWKSEGLFPLTARSKGKFWSFFRKMWKEQWARASPCFALLNLVLPGF